ncbi:MAG: endonuclease/exonuclease/phosphatase family protein [Deltaproteobacteria bacterium]|nr:endonuclease/exonuclease/phosphatase family protein [Deltaproteobacteria bacterium]
MTKWLSLLYLAGLLAVFGLHRVYGDQAWPTTILLFGPRWAWACPLLILVPLGLIYDRRSLVVQAASLGVVLMPIMGLELAWPSLGTEADGPRLRVITLNTGTIAPSKRAFLGLIERFEPDVVALQECAEDKVAPLFAGWNFLSDRGLCVASKHPLRQKGAARRIIFGRESRAIHYEVEVSGRPVQLVNLHLSTPREGLEAMIAHRWNGLGAMRQAIARRERESRSIGEWIRGLPSPLVVVGDFNMTSDGTLYRRDWSHLVNAFTEVGWGFGYSKFTRWFGIRIDHVLMDRGFSPKACRVGLDLGSDHRPVLAELAIN